MPVQKYDPSGKWLIEHQSKAILFLAGLHEPVRYQTRQAEVVQPRQLPDGLLDVIRQGHKKAFPVIVEIATYLEKRVVEQAMDDLMLVYQDRRVVPDVVILVLHPRGKYDIEEEQTLQSELGWSSVGGSWKVGKLWEVPAQELLAANDVGLIPFVPLTRFDGPAEDLLQQCRQRIEQQATYQEQKGLLAVTRVLASLRFSEETLLDIFGRSQAMVEFPMIKQIGKDAEQKRDRSTRQEAIIRFLRARFGSVPEDLTQQIRAVSALRRLDRLIDESARCADLDAFRAHLGKS